MSTPLEKLSLLVRAARAKLSGSELAVLVALVGRANSRSGQCFPSYTTIAKDTGIHRRTAIDAVGTLSDLGILSIVERRGTSNVFDINWAWARGGETATT